LALLELRALACQLGSTSRGNGFNLLRELAKIIEKEQQADPA
jgi:hypothetical protein